MGEAMTNFVDRLLDKLELVRPQILFAMFLIAVLTAGAIVVGYRMGAVEIVTGAMGMGITTEAALGMRVLEKE